MKANDKKKNVFLPIDSYVPVEYFTQTELFMKKYNFAVK